MSRPADDRSSTAAASRPDRSHEPTSANLALVRLQYAPRDQRPPASEIMAADVVWDITPGFPRGGVHRGLDSVLDDFLAPLARLFASISAQAETFYEVDDDHVVVLGDHHVRTHGGETSTVRFVHVWTVRQGRLAHLHQVADSALLDTAQPG